jgi:hypothetical protein
MTSIFLYPGWFNTTLAECWSSCLEASDGDSSIRLQFYSVWHHKQRCQCTKVRARWSWTLHRDRGISQLQWGIPIQSLYYTRTLSTECRRMIEDIKLTFNVFLFIILPWYDTVFHWNRKIFLFFMSFHFVRVMMTKKKNDFFTV